MFKKLINKLEGDRKYIELYEGKHLENTIYFELYVPSIINSYLTDSNILDLGSGQQVRNISLEKNNVVYSDISVNAMKVAIKNRVTANFIVLDAQKLPFKDNAFASIVCKDILEHVPNDKLCANEINRVLKDEGIVGIWVPSTLITKDVENWGHLRTYSIRSLRNLFDELDLKYVANNRTWSKNIFYKFVLRLILQILSFLPWQITSEYKYFNKLFSINNYEYVLYLYEKYIDKIILKRFPHLANNIIAIFCKKVSNQTIDRTRTLNCEI